jgi:hypothetical protein
MEIDSVNSVPVQNSTPPPPEEVPVSSTEPVPADQVIPSETHTVDYFA